MSANGATDFPHDGEDRFPKALRTSFLRHARPAGARRNQIIVAEGSLSCDVYLVTAGRVKVSRVSRQGQEQILGELGPDEIFGELAALDHQPRSADVIAAVDTRLAVLSAEEFIAFVAETPAAGLWLTRRLSTQVRELSAKFFALATTPASVRVQCELMRRIGPRRSGAPDTASIDPFPTHAELGKIINVQREAVTRELGLLKREGILTQTGRRLDILSASRLEAMVRRYLG
jgi:CRP-like cAMP-binding protein